MSELTNSQPKEEEEEDEEQEYCNNNDDDEEEEELNPNKLEQEIETIIEQNPNNEEHSEKSYSKYIIYSNFQVLMCLI